MKVRAQLQRPVRFRIPLPPEFNIRSAGCKSHVIWMYR